MDLTIARALCLAISSTALLLSGVSERLLLIMNGILPAFLSFTKIFIIFDKHVEQMLKEDAAVLAASRNGIMIGIKGNVVIWPIPVMFAMKLSQ